VDEFCGVSMPTRMRWIAELALVAPQGRPVPYQASVPTTTRPAIPDSDDVSTVDGGPPMGTRITEPGVLVQPAAGVSGSRRITASMASAISPGSTSLEARVTGISAAPEGSFFAFTICPRLIPMLGSSADQ